MSHCLRSHGSTLVLTGDAVIHMCTATVAKQAPGVSEAGFTPRLLSSNIQAAEPG